jgi:(S)-ureidoglycine aminohydrolase
VQGLGDTRSTLRATHLLHTPDSFVRARFPGMQLATATVHASPELGAKFLQYTAEFEPQGTLGKTNAQRFVYVLSGEVVLDFQTHQHTLKKNSFAYLPEEMTHSVTAKTKSYCAVIEKPYQRLDGVEAPQIIVSHEEDSEPRPLLGDDDLQVRSLLPDTIAFDFAVNTMVYKPGAALAMVEVHVMEHGLLMLEGGGIYRLGDNWYPVKAGDFIWMSPYCPQWFGALGKVPAKYLIYKNWNRSY